MILKLQKMVRPEPSFGISANVGLEKTSRCSSVVEHFLGKEEVGSSILLNGSIKN
jgi:hypothetical protein